jgi:hypothetical protein
MSCCSCRLTKRDDGMMEFDQILLLPPLLAAVYAVPRQRPTRVASLSITSFLPPPRLPGPASVGVFRSVTYSLSRLDDLLTLLFGETLHSSLARARGKEEGWQRFPFLAISFVCSSSIGDFLAYNVSNPYGMSYFDLLCLLYIQYSQHSQHS